MATAEATASLLSKLEKQLLTCAVCLDFYTDPKVLSCHHVFCQQCLEGLLDSEGDTSSVACPTCRQRTELPEPGVAGFPVAFHLNDLKEIYSQTLANQSQMVCSSHNRVLEGFCETCDQVVCFQCVAQSHRKHEWNSVTDSYFRHCQKLELGLNSVRESIKNILTTLTERENEIREQGEMVKEEIHVMVEEMIDALRQSERQLTREVETVTDCKLQVLSQQKELAKKRLSHLENYVEQSHKKDSPHQVLSSRKKMMDHMNQVTEEINVEFNPLEKADIQLIKDCNVVEASKSLHHIGDIVSTTLQQCKVKVIDQNKHHPGKEGMISFPLSIRLPGSSPLTVPLSSLSCSLVPVDKGQPITATVTSTTHPGVYRIHCSPSTRHGRHQVNVQVHDVRLQAASLVIPFNLYLHTNTPICTVGELNRPWGVAVNDGNVIVTEYSGHCVTVLDREGKKLKSFGGDKGSGNVKFTHPCGVAITPDNSILVTDNHRIQKITMDGECIASFDKEYSRQLDDYPPAGIAISPVTGNIYVADRGNHRIQVLTPDLTYSSSFGKGGSAKGQFSDPLDIAIDSQGLLYVTDWSNNRIQKFTPEGKFQAQFGIHQLNYPCGITIDSTGLVYVTEENNRCISIFTGEGQFVHRFGREIFTFPYGITFGNEMLYVCDYTANGLVIF